MRLRLVLHRHRHKPENYAVIDHEKPLTRRSLPASSRWSAVGGVLTHSKTCGIFATDCRDHRTGLFGTAWIVGRP